MAGEENSDTTEIHVVPGFGQLLGAALAGLLAAAICGTAWLGLALAFRLQAGVLALVVGCFTGWAVSRAGRARDTSIRVLAAFWSLIGVVLGKIGIFWKLGVSPFARADYHLLLELLWLSLAVGAAWWVAGGSRAARASRQEHRSG